MMILSGHKILAMANAGQESSEELFKRPVNEPIARLRMANANDQRRKRGEIINKCSHNNMLAFKRPNDRLQTNRTRANGAPINLILSIALGLVLAAIHSNAFSGETTNSSGARSSQSPPPSSSPMPNQNDNNNNNQNNHHHHQNNNQQELAKSSVQSNQKLLQQPAISSSGVPTSKPLANLNSESPSINLIPIDQPMLSGADSSVGPTSPVSIARTLSSAGANNSPRQDDSYDGSRINLRPAGQVAPPTDSPPVASQHETANEDFSGQSQQQQSIVDEELPDPVVQYYANQIELNGPTGAAAAGLQQTGGNAESQQDLSQSLTKQSQSSRQLERRFGLFKKGGHFQQQQQQQQHFGQPASYLANPFMSECERCLAGFNQQQQTAELQLEPNLPPLPAPSPQPSPTLQPIQPMQPATLPPPQMGHFPMQPFGPFKSKFFMKFPFLMKGNGGGGFDQIHSPLLTAPNQFSSYQPPAHYWPLPAASVQSYSGHHQNSHHHHHHRPPMSQALFVRPAPAYNCVQASPTMLTAATSATSQAEAIPLLSQSKTSALTGGGSGATKQHHYANQHHHQQQQVQSGYAKK